MTAPASIIEEAQRQFAVDVGYAQHMLQTCAPDREVYWAQYAVLAQRVVSALVDLQAHQQRGGLS